MLDIESDIKSLKLEKETIHILRKNNINIVKQLFKNTKTSLKKLGLSNEQISEVEIKLQLEGYDLKGRTEKQ